MSHRYRLITHAALIALLFLGCATSPATRLATQAKPTTPAAPTAPPPAAALIPPSEPPLPRTVLPQAPTHATAPGPAVSPAASPPREERVRHPHSFSDTPAPQPTSSAPPADPHPLDDIFFDFDSAALRPEAITILRKNLQWLEAHPTVAILLEGHCDERGSTEYNVALGKRRADAGGDYLTKAGLSPTRLHTMSYGKELPFAIGHDEAAWQLNRRAHFRLNEELPRHAFEFPAAPATGPPIPRRQPPP